MGHASQVSSSLSYSDSLALVVDAKRIASMTMNQAASVEQVQEELRKGVVSALKHKKMLHIMLHKGSLPFRSKYCSESHFPDSIFSFQPWSEKSRAEEEESWQKIVRPEGLVYKKPLLGIQS